MELTIYNSIIHGNLNPQNGQVPVDYSDIAHLLNNNLHTLPEVEKQLKQVLGKNNQVNFDADTPVNIAQFLSTQNYTSIEADYFPPDIALLMPSPQTPVQRFYYFIITTEAKRIKLRLLQSVEVLKDDICAKQEITNVLKLLSRYAKNIQEQTQPNSIFDLLLTQIVKLYFEITLIFDVLLSETDFVSFPDFYSLRLNQQVNKQEIAAYHKALHIHQAQQLNTDSTTASNLLLQLYEDLETTPTDNTLIVVICALENAIFLQTENSAIPSFSEIADNSFAKSLLKDKKQIFNQRLNTISNAREALASIEDIAESLPDFLATKAPATSLLASSVARQLQKWLTEQKEIYKNNAAQIFVPTVPTNGARATKPKAAQQKMSIQKQKSIAQKHIAYLSGYNRKNEKIMSDEDFAKLVSSIYSLIDTGITPQNLQPIPQTGTTNEFLRYTFYLIHKELYSTRPIRPEWIDLLHAIFIQFKDVERETTRKKFSTKPSYYDEDIREIGKQKKM